MPRMRIETHEEGRDSSANVFPFGEGSDERIVVIAQESVSARGSMEPARVSWTGIGSAGAERARLFAEGLSAAVRLAEGMNVRNEVVPPLPEIRPGVYEHFKGRRYRVLGLTRHTETGEDTVVYAPLYETDGPALTNRPLAMFLEEVDAGGGEMVPRFRYVGGEE